MSGTTLGSSFWDYHPRLARKAPRVETSQQCIRRDAFTACCQFQRLGYEAKYAAGSSPRAARSGSVTAPSRLASR